MRRMRSWIIWCLLLAFCTPGHAQGTAGAAPSWSSPSLRSETVVGPNGAVTTPADLTAAVEAAKKAGRTSVLVGVLRSGRTAFLPIKISE
jgi:hypothetical protein